MSTTEDDYDRHPNPVFLAYRTAAETQLLAIHAWEAYWQTWCRIYDHMLAEQVAFLDPHHPFRRWHAELARASDLMDRYGHRSHDVDVERI